MKRHRYLRSPILALFAATMIAEPSGSFAPTLSKASDCRRLQYSAVTCRLRRPNHVTYRRNGGSAAVTAMFELNKAGKLEAGCVLVASPEDYGHFTMQSVALVYEHGEGGTRAVCVDRGTPFTIGEMSNGELGPLYDNRLYRGGEDGGSAAVMIHRHDIDGATPIGNSGLFVGGLASARQIVQGGTAPAEDFKFFFNYMSWSTKEINNQIRKGKWRLAKLDNDTLLFQKSMGDRELWDRINRVISRDWSS